MRIAVVDDNDLWRSSLVAALRSRDIDVVIDAADGGELETAVDAGDGHPLDVAIVDLRLPPTWCAEGIDLGRRLRERFPGIGIIVRSGYEPDLHRAHSLHELGGGSGGVGYLYKDRTSRADLRNAALRVADCQVVVDPELLRRASNISGLSRIQTDLLQLLAQGRTNKELAAELFLSIPTVERHLKRAFQVLLPPGNGSPGENRRVRAVLEWLRRTGRLR